MSCSTECPYTFFLYQIQHFWGGRSNGGKGGGDRTLGLFVKSFLPALREKTTQEHLFTWHRSACEVWLDTDILENFTQNGVYVVFGWSHSINGYWWEYFVVVVSPGEPEELIKHGLRALRETLPNEQELTTKVQGVQDWLSSLLVVYGKGGS